MPIIQPDEQSAATLPRIQQTNSPLQAYQTQTAGMTSAHKRNVVPTLSSARCGARTRSGGFVDRPQWVERYVVACTVMRRGPAYHLEIKRTQPRSFYPRAKGRTSAGPGAIAAVAQAARRYYEVNAPKKMWPLGSFCSLPHGYNFGVKAHPMRAEITSPLGQITRRRGAKRSVLPRDAVGNILAGRSLGGDEISILESRIRQQSQPLRRSGARCTQT